MNELINSNEKMELVLIYCSMVGYGKKITEFLQTHGHLFHQFKIFEDAYLSPQYKNLYQYYLKNIRRNTKKVQSLSKNGVKK